MAGPGPGDPDEQYDFLFKLVLVGDASVGKTCVVQRFKTGAFSERQGSTIGVDFTMKTLEIQGQRVKVGGRARGPHGSRGRPRPGGSPLRGRGPRQAPDRSTAAGPPALPPVRAGLGLGVGAGLRAQIAGLGAWGARAWGCGEKALPSELHPHPRGLCSSPSSPAVGSLGYRPQGCRAGLSLPHRGQGPQLGPRWGPQAAKDTLPPSTPHG